MLASQPSRKQKTRCRRDRRGAVLVLSLFFMALLFGFCAFAIDLGYICCEKARCQNAADAASHAAAVSLLQDRDAIDSAIELALQVLPDIIAGKTDKAMQELHTAR